MNFETISQFSGSPSITTYIVSAWLSSYFILSFFVLFSRVTYLAAWKNKEGESLEALLLGEKDLSRTHSVLRKCTDTSLPHLGVYKNLVGRHASNGLTWLSIVVSTSPFIGLFGTIVSILETFGDLETQNSLSTIAPKISEVLVVTGCGILVAIPAYTFHLIIKRKAFELLSIIDSGIKVISSNK